MTGLAFCVGLADRMFHVLVFPNELQMSSERILAVPAISSTINKQYRSFVKGTVAANAVVWSKSAEQPKVDAANSAKPYRTENRAPTANDTILKVLGGR